MSVSRASMPTLRARRRLASTRASAGVTAARPHQWARGGRGAKNGAKFTSQLTSAPTPTSVPYTAPMHHRSPLQSPQHEFPSGASDAGVYQLSRQHAAVVRRQQQPHLVELRALGLVHGHGEGAVVLREGGGMEDRRDVRGVAGEPGEDGAVFAAQADADVAVEQAVAVAVLGDEQSKQGSEIVSASCRGGWCPYL